ncbi:MAG: hypothetical protein HY042_10655 [Spirochaetia bacterium]|nr:hypothetical protein [Spirochaetia bacterium]
MSAEIAIIAGAVALAGLYVVMQIRRTLVPKAAKDHCNGCGCAPSAPGRN